MLSKPKSKKIATLLALSSIALPISGLHKFYLGQPVWGVLYLLLFWTPIPRIASLIEGVWYLAQNQHEFDLNFNWGVASAPDDTPVNAQQVTAIAQSLRELDSLRQDGLISEYEFEQKRRQLLDRLT